MRVLATKLRLPPPRPDLVVRPRLRERLAAAEDGRARLVLVSAPAGAGKTTVLSQWLASRDAPRAVAWMSLDGGDNDLRRFLEHLVTGLRATNPAVGQEALALVETSGDPPAEAVLTSLVNDLDTLSGPTVLALDDYHAITAPPVHEAVRFLLDHLPGQVLVALATRSDPPLPLARLRSEGGLLELRAADLRFTLAEAAALLNDVMGLGLPPSAVAALDHRTEGWAAGLQLAALSMRGREDVAAFVDAFAGSQRFVLDYLVEEVLDRQPEEVRDFLLTTSILRELTGPLCAALTGRRDAQDVLEGLERHNLFVVPLDDRRTWYRYHHLFADALRARLLSLHAERIPTLHAAASRWHAEHGAMDEAIRHAAAAEDHERTADLVELVVPDLNRRRRDDAIRHHLRLLPADVLRDRGLLAAAAAWSRLGDGDLSGVEDWLDAADRAAGESPQIAGDLRSAMPVAARARDQELRQVPAMTAVYRASVAQARGDVAGTVAHARRALQLTQDDDHYARGAAAGFLGLAAWAEGRTVEALDTFSRAVAALGAAGRTDDELGATVVLAGMWVSQGRPDQARRVLDGALTAAQRHAPTLPALGDVHVALAEVLREQDDLDGATLHLDAARALGDAASLPENRHRWYVAGAGLLQAEGDLDGALEMLGHAERLYQPGFFPDLRPVSSLRARLWIAQGCLAEAERWARDGDLTPETPPTYLNEHSRLTLARLLLAQHRSGSPAPVVRMLDAVVESAEAVGRTGSVVEAWVLRALAHAEDDDLHAALGDLGAALSHATTTGYRRLFLDEGVPMRSLLRELVRHQPHGDAGALAAGLLAGGQRARPPARDRSPAHQRLSERELEVLRLLATDLSGPEIARRLYVSVNTLRTHTKHIFTKLAVTTRRAAVTRAVGLGLLSDEPPP